MAIFSENPASHPPTHHPTIQTSSFWPQNSILIKSKVICIDKQTSKMRLIQLQHQWGAEIAIFSKDPTTHLSRPVDAGHKREFLAKIKLFTLINRHQKMYWTQPLLQLGLRQLYFQKIQQPRYPDKQFLTLKQHYCQKQSYLGKYVTTKICI